jgi:chromosome segregation ATPase
MKDLEKLKMLRNRRMEQQFIELQTQRQILDGWHNQIFSKQQQISDFKQWRVDYQDQLFHSLQNQPFNVQTMKSYHEKLSELEQEEIRLHIELDSIRQGMRQAETEVEQARKKSTDAILQLEKVKEIIQQSAHKPLV